MPRKRIPSKTTVGTTLEQAPGNAKVCEKCGTENSFKRVKCEKCKALLPEGKFERSRRMRQQALRRERQVALSSTLFSDRPLVPDDTDDTGEAANTKSSVVTPTNSGASGKKTGKKGRAKASGNGKS